MKNFLRKFSIFGVLFFLLIPLFLLYNKAQASFLQYDKTFVATSDQGIGGNSIAFDSLGNKYIVGSFQGTADFNITGQGGPDIHISAGNKDAFLTKINANGTYAWTYTFGSTSIDEGFGVITDSNNNVYVTGSFIGTDVNFDPTGGDDQHTAPNGYPAIFITKINANASYAWTYTMGGDHLDEGRELAVDSNDNLYIAGVFRSESINFDPTGGTDTHTSENDFRDVFLTKINSDASYDWTYTFGDTDETLVNELAIDSDDNIYIAGSFRGQDVNFDPTGGEDLHSDGDNENEPNSFVTKINADASYGWTYSFPLGTDQIARNTVLAIDNNNDVIITGVFMGTDVNFDATGGTDLHSSQEIEDIFITKLGSNGSYQWTYTIVGDGANVPYSIVTDNFGNIYISGTYTSDSVNFDPTGGEDIFGTSVNGEIFITKFNADYSYAWTRSTNFETLDYIFISEMKFYDEGLYIIGYFGSSAANFHLTGGTDIKDSGGERAMFLTELQLIEASFNLLNFSNVQHLQEGESVVYEIGLESQPTSNVEITFQIDQPRPWAGEGVEISPSKLTFTTTNWNTPQKVTITAIADKVITGTRQATIHHNISTFDSGYNLLDIDSIRVVIEEFDISRPNRQNGLGGKEFKITSIDGDDYGRNRTVRTDKRKPSIRFNRSVDEKSGVDYYQIRVYDTDSLGRKSGREYALFDNIQDQPATNADRIRQRNGFNIKYRGTEIEIEQTTGHAYELKPGTYFVRVRAFDQAGNSRTTNEIRLIIDEKYTEEYKRLAQQGKTPLSQDTTLTLTHIGRIPNAGAYSFFYYTSEYMVFSGKISDEQGGFDVQVIINGIEVARRPSETGGVFNVPAKLGIGQNQVEIKIASLDTLSATKEMTIVVDPTRQSFPQHLR